MKVNPEAVKHAKRLIEDGKYVTDTDWSESQPSAQDENKLLEKHNWSDYSQWFLGLDTDENEDTKGRYKFPYGDFKQVHRDGVIAAKQRAAQNDYAEIEKAADQLLDMIDKREAKQK
jgi:hypothetical protein